MASLISLILFLSVGFYFLNSEEEKKVQQNVSSEPYAAKLENAGVLFKMNDSCVYFFLDFEKEFLNLIYIQKDYKIETDVYGYPIDYTINADYDVLVDIIDSVDGIDLELSEENLTYTGVQVKEILTTTVDNEQLKREITEKTIEKIAKYGFLRQDFFSIIENSETNLTIPECYYWSDNIQKLCKNLRVIN